MKPRSLLAWIAALAFVGTVAACSNNGVGRLCQDPRGPDAGVIGTQIVTPALECTSRICIFREESGGVPRSVCTVKCESDDDCSDGEKGQASEGRCPSKFVCAVATVAGTLHCQRLCVCQDDLEDDVNRDPVTGKVIVPPACR
jgi:hypothetical protein